VGFGAKMYLLDQQNQKWVEVTDFIDSDTSGVEIFLPQDDITLDVNNPNRIVIVHPIIEKKDQEVTLLIMIKGTVLENNQETGLVGSYIVTTLKS